jgi:hypothetical protein
VIATEVVCCLRYSQHVIVATGINRAQVAAQDSGLEPTPITRRPMDRGGRSDCGAADGEEPRQEEEHADDLNDLLGN